MGKPPKYRQDRSRKRKFRGNQHCETSKAQKLTPILVDDETDSESETECQADLPKLTDKVEFSCSEPETVGIKNTSSNVKLTHVQEAEPEEEENQPTGNRLVNVSSLLNFLSEFGHCSQCVGKLVFIDETLHGLASTFKFKCSVCDACFDFLATGYTPFDSPVNLLFTSAITSIGKNLADAQKLVGTLDMPPPVSSGTWNKSVANLAGATEHVAKTSMEQGAEECKDYYNSSEVTVSCDGTWQRRGFSSKNGVATCLSVAGDNSKVIDIEVLSTFCRKCSVGRKKMTHESFSQWYENHKDSCDKNHEGSAGAMEPHGVSNIFRRSEEKHGLKYTGYLGDGDCKSYATVANADVYNVPIKKLECCGHVQKKMYNRLQKKVQENKNCVFKENGKTYKGLSGAGRLTRRTMLNLQGHYGAAVRNNAGNVKKMQQDIMGIYYHGSGNHDKCPTWCPANPACTKSGDPNKNKLPDFVCKIIKPVFEELSSLELLEKCAHGGTQNTNESYHHLNLGKGPKDCLCGKDQTRACCV